MGQDLYEKWLSFVNARAQDRTIPWDYLSVPHKDAWDELADSLSRVNTPNGSIPAEVLDMPVAEIVNTRESIWEKIRKLF